MGVASGGTGVGEGGVGVGVGDGVGDGVRGGVGDGTEGDAPTAHSKPLESTGCVPCGHTHVVWPTPAVRVALLAGTWAEGTAGQPLQGVAP
jgi:hypothetical protein